MKNSIFSSYHTLFSLDLNLTHQGDCVSLGEKRHMLNLGLFYLHSLPFQTPFLPPLAHTASQLEFMEPMAHV